METKTKPIILIIDDDSISSMLLVSILKKNIGQEFQYVTLNNGLKAIDFIEKQNESNHLPVMVIADWWMPDCQGDELLINIYQKFNSIHLILYSSFNDENVIKNLQDKCNLLCYISKPWNGIENIDLIKKTLAKQI